MLTVLQSWGVATRSGRVVADNALAFEVALGPSIVRWDLTAQHDDGCSQHAWRTALFQAHNDLVTFFQEAPSRSRIITASHDGTVKLWSHCWSPLDTTNISPGHISTGAFALNGTAVALVCQGPAPCVVVVAGCDAESLVKVWRAPLSAGAVLVQWTSASVLTAESLSLCAANTVVRVRTLDAASGAAVLEHVFSPAAAAGGLSALAPVNAVGHTALGFSSGVVWVVNTTTLACVATVAVLSMPKTLDWVAASDGFALVAVHQNGTVLVCSDKSYTTYSQYGTRVLGNVDYAHVDPATSHAWLFSRSGMHRVAFAVSSALPTLAVTVPVLAEHHVTCCGVSFNEQGSRVCTGDFCGNIIIWDPRESVALARVCLPAGQGVRAIAWEEARSVFWVGGMSGGIFIVRASAPFSVTLVTTVPGSAVTMRVPPNTACCNVGQLAVGTSEGHVYLLENGVLKHHFRAHEPVLTSAPDALFGSLHLWAEVWSLVFSPDGSKLATASEDQTARVWRMPHGAPVVCLRGHTLAVTCVDWHLCADQQTSVMCTCSDDQTVRVYDGTLFYLRGTVATSLHGWHTLTYMRVVPAHNLIVVATQHGYIVAWSLDSFALVFAKKIHGGSIEGLVVHDASAQLCSVSADNSVHLFDFSSIRKR